METAQMKLIAKPVDALVYFFDRKQPRPYKFRYRDEDGKDHVVVVDKVLSVSERNIPGSRSYIFECQSFNGSFDYRYELRYIPDSVTGQWQLYKI